MGHIVIWYSGTWNWKMAFVICHKYDCERKLAFYETINIIGIKVHCGLQPHTKQLPYCFVSGVMAYFHVNLADCSHRVNLVLLSPILSLGTCQHVKCNQPAQCWARKTCWIPVISYTTHNWQPYKVFFFLTIVSLQLDHSSTFYRQSTDLPKCGDREL